MSEYWEQNLQALNCPRYQKLYKAISTQQIAADSEEKFTCEITEIENRKILYAVKENHTYQLDSLYSSNEAMDIWFESQTTLGYMTKCIFCGLGNGMYINKLLQCADSTVQIAVYEPSSIIFLKAMKEFDLSAILKSERVTVIVQNYYDVSIVDFLYKFVHFNDIKNAIYQAYPNYSRLMPKSVKQFDTEIQKLLIAVRASSNVLARYGVANCLNSLKNLSVLEKSKTLQSFYELCPKDIPVFLIASGPSLNKNVEILKKAKGKGLLIAADSAMPVLMKHDVMPDFMITMDSMKNRHHLEDLRCRDIPLICELESGNAIVVRQKVPSFFTNDLNPYVNKFLSEHHIEMPVFSTGGSVANTACAIMTSMGFHNIVLVGQDLAYSDNKTHAEGTLRGNEKVDLMNENVIELPGYYGGKVSSCSEFMLYLKWFENEIAKNKDIVFYNATEGGALIQGAQNITLSDAVHKLCVKETDIAEIVNRSSYLFDETDLTAFHTYIDSLGSHLEKYQEQIKKGIRNYQKIIDMVVKGKIRREQIQTLLQETTELTNAIEKAPEMYYVFCLAQIEIQEISNDIYDKKESIEHELLSSAGKGREYLVILDKTIQKMIAREPGTTADNITAMRHPNFVWR